MFARWDKMSKAFTRISKEIVIAVKAGGPQPENNPSLRRAIQNARNMNMPKDKVASAIKRASGQDVQAYEEILYEGYGPHGVAILVETATDNSVRTVSNLRTMFKKADGNLANSGAVSFMFKRMGVFRLSPEGVDQEALELDLIDFGLEEMGESTNDAGETQLVLRCAFTDLGTLQKALEERNITPLSVEPEYIPQTMTELGQEEADAVLKLIDTIEQDDDVQKVFHNLG